MELLRALGAVIEKPDATVGRFASLLELPGCPTIAEHTFLFEAQLVPLASRYLSGDGQVASAITERMASYWRAIGAVPPCEPDRLGRLLLFYADLLDMQTQETDEARRHAIGRLRKTVLWDHLLTWLPAYLTKVDLIAPRSYRRWAQLLWRVLAREAWTVGSSATIPPFLAEPVEPALPSPHDIAALVAHLTAPGRSGLILAPIDVTRAADALHTLPPPGPLGAALASLIEARPAGMLDWLATEARRWETRHERNRDLLPALSDHWMRRARATRAVLQTLTRTGAARPNGLTPAAGRVHGVTLETPSGAGRVAEPAAKGLR
jgi:hypothetical protein